MTAKRQVLQFFWKINLLQTLVEIVSERQALQTVGRGHSVKALAQEIIHSQTFADCLEGSLFQNIGAKHGRKSNFAHWLAKVTCSKLWLKHAPKVNVCKLLGKGHLFQASVEIIAKGQRLQTAWQSESF